MFELQVFYQVSHPIFKYFKWKKILIGKLLQITKIMSELCDVFFFISYIKIFCSHVLNQKAIMQKCSSLI